MFFAVYEQADQVLRDWLNLDIVIGQRVSDVLLLQRTHIISQGRMRFLELNSGKTGTMGVMKITGDLAPIIDEMIARPRKVTGRWLIQTNNGQRVTHSMLRDRFDEARAKAKQKEESEGRDWRNWQMRDVRKTNLNQAGTLEEARRRALHEDPKTTARNYELLIKSVPGKLPKRARNPVTRNSGND
jgi:hypothetical protein